MESVRTATAADLTTVTSLVDEFIAEQRGLRGGVVWAALEAPRLSAESIASMLDDSLSPKPSHLVLLGYLDDTAVGVAVVAFQPVVTGETLAVIRVIHVHPDAREVGVGSLLIESVVDAAVNAGCSGVDATVLPGNRSAKNFFEAHGLVARAISVHRAVGERS